MAPLQWNARSKYVQSFADEIRNAASNLTATQAQIGEENGLRLEHWRALSVIDSSGFMLSISDLARRLRLARQSAHSLVVGLERAGWIRLSSNPDDRRLIQMEMTRSGKDGLRVADTRLRHWLLMMTDDLSDHELCRLIYTLRSIRGRIARSRDYA